MSTEMTNEELAEAINKVTERTDVLQTRVDKSITKLVEALQETVAALLEIASDELNGNKKSERAKDALNNIASNGKRKD